MSIPGTQSLSGRLSWLIVGALSLIQVFLFVLFFSEFESNYFGVQQEERIHRIVSALKVIEGLSPAKQKAFLEAAGDSEFGMFVEEAPPPTSFNQSERFDQQLLDLSQAAKRQVHLVSLRDWAETKNISAAQMVAWFDEDWPILILAGLALKDGRWMYATLYDPANFFFPELLKQLFLLIPVSFVLIGLIIFSVRRLTRPLSMLAESAQRFGRGEAFKPLPLKGTKEVRSATEAFNHMGERLERHVTDRQQLLSAISHDLRSPLTGMRLQAEFIETEEVRNSVISGVEEMQQMIESVLNFTREDAQTESVVPVDVNALLQDLTTTYQAQGADVVLVNQKEMPDGTINTRHLALKRAMRNLVDNALKYGQRAELTLHKSKTKLLITIEDEGDGIPDQALERVFEPFTQLDTARSTNRSGVGMGLSVARSLLRASGGDVFLENRSGEQKGLQVRVCLPLGV